MHTRTWLIWLTSGVLLLSLAPHPLYAGLMILAAAQVFFARHDDGPLVHSFALFTRAGAIMTLSYLLFSLVSVGTQRGPTVLLTLPAVQLPVWLGSLVFGGALTAEALATGLTRGMAVWALLTLFGAFNALVDHYRLLRMTPRALFHAGLAVTIAVAFVPGLVRTVSAITAAQRTRGHRFRGVAAWFALVSPLLAGSLERSLQLAEALDARGYGRTLPQGRRRQPQAAALLVGLLLLLLALALWLAALQPLGAAALAAVGLALLGWAAHALNHSVARSRYRRERWRRHDTIVSAAALLALLLIGWVRLNTPAALVYQAWPLFSLPLFDLRVGLAVVLLSAPALVNVRPAQETARRLLRGHNRRELGREGAL